VLEVILAIYCFLWAISAKKHVALNLLITLDFALNWRKFPSTKRLLNFVNLAHIQLRLATLNRPIFGKWVFGYSRFLHIGLGFSHLAKIQILHIGILLIQLLYP
jgi:hypothetical protein